MSEEAKWYVIHTYSGYENKVATSIEALVENRGIHDLICQVRIPMETVKEIKNGEEVEVERKLFPGYVLVKMIVNDDTWILLRNIRGVTGFVGPGGQAVPLTEEELEKIGIKKEIIEIPYHVGDNVKVLDGAMRNMTGNITEVIPEQGKVRVLVSMFGRELPVELLFTQVELLNK